MAWTTPGTAVAGTVISSSFWNTNSQADILALYNSSFLLYTSTVLSSSQSTIDYTGIPTTWKNLCIKIYPLGATTSILVRFNNDSAANYDYGTTDISTSANVATYRGYGAVAQTSIALVITDIAYQDSPVIEIYIPGYADTDKHKSIIGVCDGVGNWTAGTSTYYTFFIDGWWRSTAAINQITFVAGAGNFTSGTSVYIYSC